MIRYDCAQRSEEWDRLRLGIPTSSEFHRIVKGGTAYRCGTCDGEYHTKRKKCECGAPVAAIEILKPSTQAEAYMHRLLAEWYFGGPLEDPESQYKSAWMERGQFLEDQAVKSYEFETGTETEKVGFLTTDDGMVGCSPDRLVVGDEGVLEIKCPSPAVHMGYMVKRSVDDDYWPQLQAQLWLSGRSWVDIESYCPPFPTVIIRVPRDEQYIGLLSVELAKFVHAMQQARTLIEKTYGPPLRSKEVVTEPES